MAWPQQRSDVALGAVPTAVCPLLSGAGHRPGAGRGDREGRGEGQTRGGGIQTFILSLISNIHSYPSVP